MELTAHGGERVQSRTKMLAKDVLSVVESGAVVSLGSFNCFEYLLFYSPPDREFKVAVTSEGRTHLVSVWETGYNFPEGVKKITRDRKRKATLALRTFMVERVFRFDKKRKTARVDTSGS